MSFLLQCLIGFFVLQGVLEVAGNPMVHNIHAKAMHHRLHFGRTVAECGADAAAPGATCPGNACCSQWGFCGTTREYCGAGCQSNCAPPKDPSGHQPDTSQPGQQQTTLGRASPSQGPCKKSSSLLIFQPTAQPTTMPSTSPSTPPIAQPTPGDPGDSTGKVIAGYWQGWNMGKPCATMKPEEIPVESLTHLIFSFGFVAPDTYKVLPMPDTEEGLFQQVTGVKRKNPNLKVLVALGGWTHTDPGPYREVFTTMVSSPASRQTFITNLLSFLTQYNFDGVDLDWEYPGAEERGGHPTDKENFSKLLQEMREVFQSKYVMTFAAPLASYYLQNYDLKVASEAVDWINVMAYDIHGTWESDKKAAGHTNLTDVNKGVENYIRAGVAPSKLVLGTAFYGRSVKMASTSCTQPGCTFTGPGAEGRCVKTAGYLSHTEINDVISGGATPVFDQAGSVQHLTWGGDNWVSYDDPETIKIKVNYASRKGLRGVMAWAIDMDDEQRSMTKALSGH
ncbi:brain chitinase and chia [Aspergillus bombycis]|uniref:chitinase n=1 Tax=Aspergillus bombycis TaxID=109264 RepID=A0A1F8AHV7_9EURO|nr:brain chitinase and chia [Aspergillus bombycis]OGM51306.1 brain chitinase and chia [Aspergillus bombycis]